MATKSLRHCAGYNQYKWPKFGSLEPYAIKTEDDGYWCNLFGYKKAREVKYYNSLFGNFKKKFAKASLTITLSTWIIAPS